MDLIIRCDDIGMCPEVNKALVIVISRGIPICASLMTVCPAYQESINLLRHCPEVSLGIHLTLNSEWKNYRWKPLSRRSVVPTLIDSAGYLYPTRAALFSARPKLEHIEQELRAQIERALSSRLKSDYLDYHMFAAVATRPLQEIVEKLGRQYSLRISPFCLQPEALARVRQL